MEKKRLTSENGRPIADNQNIQTAGPRGPVMLQDPWYIEKLAHFRPRGNSRTANACKRFRSVRNFYRYARYYPVIPEPRSLPK